MVLILSVYLNIQNSETLKAPVIWIIVRIIKSGQQKYQRAQVEFHSLKFLS